MRGILKGAGGYRGYVGTQAEADCSSGCRESEGNIEEQQDHLAKGPRALNPLPSMHIGCAWQLAQGQVLGNAKG